MDEVIFGLEDRRFFTNAGQDAPRIHAGEEWPFLMWGEG